MKTRTITVDVPAPEQPKISARLLSMPEAAEALGMSRAFLYRQAKEGMIRTIKLGGRRLVAVSEIDAFVVRQLGQEA